MIAALVLGMLIGSTTTALAARDFIQATVAKFKFVVNGQEKEVKTELLVVMGTHTCRSGKCPTCSVMM